MQYSPKLKIAMEEIKAILKKNDIAGFIVLHTPGFSEYLNHVMTSYSCATVNTDGIRLRLKESQIGKEEAQRIADGTFNMVTHLSEIININGKMYNQCYEILKQKWNGDSNGGGHTSHSQQNN